MRVCKYKDTPIFHFHNANPKGKIVSDCVVRAVSVATGKTWEETMREMTEVAIENSCTFNEDKGIRAYLESEGWVKCHEPRDCNNRKMSVAQFLKYVGFRKETLIIKAGTRHLSLIKDGVVWDTWDCTKETIHSYYRKAKV